MTSRCALGALLITAAAVAQRVELPAQVVFGQAFEVVVESERPFDAATLLPLVVEPVATSSEDGVERTRFRARCYQLGAVELPLEPPVTLQVATCLPDPPGELEWPSDGYMLRAAPTSRWLVAGLTALVLVFAFGWWSWLRRRSAVVPVDAAATTPMWDAAAALAALACSSDDEVEAFCARLKAV
ncbi:MAG: hypothetical protein KAI24_11350, partial [Planctomycetes bacterium]|nr:hypothetical protein [Planctomycetota bacterium]